MNSFNKIGIVVGLMVLVAACADKNRRNYQYMPDMYEPVGYEAYQQVDFLPDGTSAGLPADHTIARGWIPYGIENTMEGKEVARLNPSPLDSLKYEANITEGKALYTIYCAIRSEERRVGKYMCLLMYRYLYI